MSQIHSVRLALSLLAAALLAPQARAALDRPPEILQVEQVPDTNTIRLLWAPGGNQDGTLSTEVLAYKVERRGLWGSSFGTVFTGSPDAMSHVDAAGAANMWYPVNQGRSLTYRVRAVTSSGDSLSPQVTIVPALPLFPPDEALDGKVRLSWYASVGAAPYTVHLGYKVQKLSGGSWIDAHTGYLTQRTFIDPQTTAGVSRYRVRSSYTSGPGGGTMTLTSNEQEIEIHPTCEGQAPGDPALPPLAVITVGDRDFDLDYDGADLAGALEDCADVAYERLDAPGDGDGVCEDGETCVTGGCVLRALPKTYENVAIMITGSSANCNSTSNPTHCLILDFPAGLVIEGHGRQTVFRSPVWQPPYQPASILELHRRTFQFTLRNLVLDGRKHEQVYPDYSEASGWHHMGLRVWNQFLVAEIDGDSLGVDDKACIREACLEQPGGSHDGDGRCEAGEDCDEDNAAEGGDDDGVCETDAWPNADGCVSTIDADDGCIHNVEIRNLLANGLAVSNAKRWIIEDTEVHDVGCINRGYGFDCPAFDAAPDLEPVALPGLKIPGYGLSVGDFTSDFKVRRNEVYRTGKYGLNFKNGDASSCNGLLVNHEIAYNELHDLGHVGLFARGSRGARIHHNKIDGTTVWNEPPSVNAHFNTFAMSLGELCAVDNEIFDNEITNAAGVAIHWNGSTEMVECDAGGCTPVAPASSTIRDNDIAGTCLEKDTASGPTPNPYEYGSIHTTSGAMGTLFLEDNTLTNSQCRLTIAAFGQGEFVGPLDLRVTGGSYESGPNAATELEDFPYCGAVHAHGDNRKIVLGDGVTFANNTSKVIPKACVSTGATLVVKDDPFVGAFSDFYEGAAATVILCDSDPEHPDCQ